MSDTAQRAWINAFHYFWGGVSQTYLSPRNPNITYVYTTVQYTTLHHSRVEKKTLGKSRAGFQMPQERSWVLGLTLTLSSFLLQAVAVDGSDVSSVCDTTHREVSGLSVADDAAIATVVYDNRHTCRYSSLCRKVLE